MRTVDVVARFTVPLYGDDQDEALKRNVEDMVQEEFEGEATNVSVEVTGATETNDTQA
jgi:hypothetical protein